MNGQLLPVALCMEEPMAPPKVSINQMFLYLAQPVLGEVQFGVNPPLSGRRAPAAFNDRRQPSQDLDHVLSKALIIFGVEGLVGVPEAVLFTRSSNGAPCLDQLQEQALCAIHRLHEGYWVVIGGRAKVAGRSAHFPVVT